MKRIALFLFSVLLFLTFSSCDNKAVKNKESEVYLAYLDVSKAGQYESVTHEKQVSLDGKVAYGVHYPKTENEEINKVTLSFINEKINEFKKDFENIQTTKNIKAQYFIDYECFSYIENFSVLFKAETTCETPLQKKVYTLSFNKKSGQLLAPGDFFEPESGYTEALRNQGHLCFNLDEDSKTSLNEAALKEALKENGVFDNLIPTDKGFTFYFSPEAFGSSADGYTSILLPYEKLPYYLNSEILGLKKQVRPDDGVINANEFPSVKKDKLIAITFDDGPRKSTTSRLLTGLKKLNAKATFFVIGNKIEDCKTEINTMIADGHSIENHTYDHKNKLTKLDKAKFDEQVNTVDEILKKNFNITTKLLRPVGGEVNDNVFAWTTKPMIMWNIDASDYKQKKADRGKAIEILSNHILSQAKDGSIILMHDVYENSVDASLAVIAELSKQGYEFVTVEELFARKGIALSKDKYYRSTFSNKFGAGF